MTTPHRFHRTPAPAISNPDAYPTTWKTYRFNAAFYLNGRGMTQYGALRPEGKAPISVTNALTDQLANSDAHMTRLQARRLVALVNS